MRGSPGLVASRARRKRARFFSLNQIRAAGETNNNGDRWPTYGQLQRRQCVDWLRCMVMKKYQLALFLTAVLALAGIALVSASTYSVTVAQANQTQAAGVFYMAPNGDDTKDGTTIATAWKTANHQLSCGAKILVQPGAFLGDQRVVLSVQNTCPGPNCELYVMVECSGAHVQDCIVDGQGGAAFDVQSSNWLIKHFTATSNVHGTGSGYGACFSAPSAPAHAAASTMCCSSTSTRMIACGVVRRRRAII